MKNILDKINRADEIQANLELNKTELGKHEVELALVDDVKSLYNIANKSYQSNTNTIQKYASELERMFQKTADEYQKALGKYLELEKMSKELGIQLPSDIIKLRDLIEFGFSDSLESKKNATKILTI